MSDNKNILRSSFVMEDLITSLSSLPSGVSPGNNNNISISTIHNHSGGDGSGGNSNINSILSQSMSLGGGGSVHNTQTLVAGGPNGALSDNNITMDNNICNNFNNNNNFHANNVNVTCGESVGGQKDLHFMNILPPPPLSTHNSTGDEDVRCRTSPEAHGNINTMSNQNHNQNANNNLNAVTVVGDGDLQLQPQLVASDPNGIVLQFDHSSSSCKKNVSKTNSSSSACSAVEPVMSFLLSLPPPPTPPSCSGSSVNNILVSSSSSGGENQRTKFKEPGESGGSSGGVSRESLDDDENLGELFVDLEALNSTTEIAKVLENFNAILEKIEREDENNILGSKGNQSFSKIRNSVEDFADLLISGEEGDDEDLLIIVDENDPEYLSMSMPSMLSPTTEVLHSHQRLMERLSSGNNNSNHHISENISKEEAIVRGHQDLCDQDQEEGYESDRPMVRASMRKLRPVQMMPMPSSVLPTISSPGSSSSVIDNSPSAAPVANNSTSATNPNANVGFATTLNSPVTNKILVTSLINNVLNPSLLDETGSSGSSSGAGNTNSSTNNTVPIPTSVTETLYGHRNESNESTPQSLSHQRQRSAVEMNYGRENYLTSTTASGAHHRSASMGLIDCHTTVPSVSTENSALNANPNNINSVVTGLEPSATPPASTITTDSTSSNSTSSTNSTNGNNSNAAPTTGRTRTRHPGGTSPVLGPGLRMPAGRWPHRLSSVLALIGCTLGLNNICRFALLSVQYGANFILQFVFLSIVFGIPLFTFHMSIGQYLSSGIIDMWRISPIFQGIGVGLVISQAMIGIYTSVGVSWMFIYFRDSFITRYDKYRWEKCFRDYRDCSTDLYNQTVKLSETVPDYFNGVVLQRTSPDYPPTSSSYTTSSLKFTVAFNLAVVWMLIFVSLSKGLKSYGKVVHGFVLAPVAALLVLASKMVGLVPSDQAGSLFGQTEWSNFFFNSQTWVVAARETFFTWGLLGACIMQMTSHNRFTHSLKSDASIVVLVTTFVLLLSAFLGNACYSVLLSHGYKYSPSSFEISETYHFLTKSKPPDIPEPPSYINQHIPFLMGVRILTPDMNDANTARSGYQVLRLATELFPTTMSILGTESNISPFWTVLFYFTFILFGIAQQLAIWHCVVKGVIAIKSKMLRSRETTITFIVCAMGFTLGLPLCTETGIFVEYFLDYAIGSGWWIMVLYLLELVAVFIVRGAPYCGENIVTVLLTGPGKLVAILAPLVSFVWNVIMPVAMLVLSIASFKSGNIRELYDWNPAHGYAFWPSWTRELGSLLQLLPILAVPFVAIIQSCRYLTNGPPDLFDRMQQLYRPSTRGILRRTLSANYGENGASPDSSSRNSSAGRTSEDPPPKYTPPPSYSTATGAKIAKFLRNSFRRSMRRLSSPGGPSTSSASRSSENLPPPPNYASVILEINNQRSQVQNSCGEHSGTHLMIPIMVSPPEYDERMTPPSQTNGSHILRESSLLKKKLNQSHLSQTLGRSLGQSLDSSKERASLRRIASDITPRDIARILRASFRQSTESVENSSSHDPTSEEHIVVIPPSNNTNNDILNNTNTKTAPSSEANSVSSRNNTLGPNFRLDSSLGLFSDLNIPVNSVGGCSSSNATQFNNTDNNYPISGISANECSSNTSFEFDSGRNRNSNDSQLALISNSSYGYIESDLGINDAGASLSDLGIINPTFQLQSISGSRLPRDSEA